MKTSLPLSALAAQRPVLLSAPAAVANAVSASPPSPSKGLLRSSSFAAAPRKAEAALIYVVDDVEDLTDLYRICLNDTGYVVRPFNHRAKALAAFAAESIKPDLLITDCFGPSMPIEEFIRACRIVHPNVRILMASGNDEPHPRFSSIGSDRFIKKPFTLNEFLRVVSELMPIGVGAKAVQLRNPKGSRDVWVPSKGND